jgi:hypothetical protein
MDLALMMLVPLTVAGATAYALAQRESGGAIGTDGKTQHVPRATGFGRGGTPLPVERRAAEDASLELFVSDPLALPLWYRVLRLFGLAAVIFGSASLLAVGLFTVGRHLLEALRRLVVGP